MISSAEFEMARAARENIDRVNVLLLSPTLDSMISATPALEQSVDTLAHLENQVREAGHEDFGARQQLRQELRGLRQSLNGLQRLMENASAFHSGWASLIGLSAAVYTRAGELGIASRTGTLRVEG